MVGGVAGRRTRDLKGFQGQLLRSRRTDGARGGAPAGGGIPYAAAAPPRTDPRWWLLLPPGAGARTPAAVAWGLCRTEPPRTRTPAPRARSAYWHGAGGCAGLDMPGGNSRIAAPGCVGGRRPESPAHRAAPA